MKKINKYFYLLFIIIIILFVIYSKSNDISLKDDYYEAINKEVLSTNHLKDNEYTWSNFSVMQDKADEKMKELFFDTLNYNDLSDFSKIKIVYNQALDIGRRNQDGLGILSTYIDKVNNVSNVKELVDIITLIEKDLGIPILSNIVVDSDYENTNINMIYFYPVSFLFGTSGDYYVDDDYITYKAYLKRAIIQLLEVYGYSREDARSISRELMLFYEDISSNSKSISELSDISNYFDKISMLDLQNIYSNFGVEDYLRNMGIDNCSYSLVDKEQYVTLNSYLDSSNLELWKKHLLVMILSYYASYLNEDYKQIVDTLNEEVIGGKIEKSDEEVSRNMVVSLFSNELSFLYEEEVVSNEHREYLYEIFNEIKNTYKEMLKSNEWLSDETILSAIKKLESMEIYVGLDSVDKDFAAIEQMNILSNEDGGSLIYNILEIMKVRRNMELVRLKTGADKRAVAENVVNAYYSPMNNAVYIPSAAIYMMDLNKSYFENLGMIGMVIAHEITHGFDLNGSRFDEFGNFSNWWLNEDIKKFSKLKDNVVEYYSNYEVLNGRFIDGDLTVNENIADLGALRCLSLLLEKKKASSLDKKEMYSSFAKFWVNQSNDSYTKLLLLQDTHAPNKYRVNAVLSSLEDFYDLYNISFWNDMYVKKRNRVQVW